MGGIKEKVLAAKRSGVRELILPFENEVNVREDLKTEQIGDVKIHYVKAMEEVVDLALEEKPHKAGPAAGRRGGTAWPVRLCSRTDRPHSIRNRAAASTSWICGS